LFEVVVLQMAGLASNEASGGKKISSSIEKVLLIGSVRSI
jgi:hypothetical protein